MANFPHHQSLRLQNFTAFQDATFDFVPGINVLIGENGSGKTHVLKVLYSVQYACSQSRENAYHFASSLPYTFQSPLHELIRWNNYQRSRIAGNWMETEWYVFVLPPDPKAEEPISGTQHNATMTVNMPRPIFIPAIDMMGHTRRFVSTYDEYNIDFDQTHRDIVRLLLAPERRDNGDDNNTSMTALAELLGGTIEEEGERFYLKTPQGRLRMPLVAEGLRKIATLYQLYRNGFLRPGATLFWDEPENNLNPILMDEVVRALLALARSGVQIFLATHSYFVLKELDLQAGMEDSVRFFSLEKTDEGTKVHASDDYAQLSPNPIADQFDYIYDRQLTRATGRKPRK